MIPDNNRKMSLAGVLKTIGPGILYAGAAIGASHLVLSTRAGANYNFDLIWAVILINLIKYPFFEFSYRYTAITGKSMLEGYRNLGKWAIILFFVLSFFTAIVNFAAVTKVTADLLAYVFDLHLNSFVLSTGLLALILFMLFIGRYALLDKAMKFMIVVLAICTVLAFFIALSNGSQIQEGFIPPVIWDSAGLTFLIVLMGWMPTPIDASIWPSLWALERKKQTNYVPTFREARLDFHIGYLGSAVLALFFLGLGALMMHGSGKVFSDNGVIFSQQLVALYADSIGNWSTGIIAVVVLITMFSTALTVIDGYPRSLEGSLFQLFPGMNQSGRKWYIFWTLFLSVAAILIIGVFTKDMGSLLYFATIVSFLTAPVFAFINYKVVTSNLFPAESHPKLWLKVLSWTGISFLFIFSVLYLFTNIIN